MVKLTTAPIAASKTVLKTSAELIFGITLKNVPPAVPIKVGLFALMVILSLPVLSAVEGSSDLVLFNRQLTDR